MKFCNQEVEPIFTKYRNGNLCLTVKDEDGYIEEVLTVNLKQKLSDKNCAFIDTNRQINVLNFLKKNKFGTITGNKGKTEFACYPEFKFDDKIVSKYLSF